MTATTREALEKIAQDCRATFYRNRSNPHQPAVAFGDEAWAKFTAALADAPAVPVQPANFDEAAQQDFKDPEPFLPDPTAPAAVQQGREALSAFAEKCAGFAGGMVNGNKLSEAALAALAATPQAPQPTDLHAADDDRLRRALGDIISQTIVVERMGYTDPQRWQEKTQRIREIARAALSANKDAQQPCNCAQRLNGRVEGNVHLEGCPQFVANARHTAAELVAASLLPAREYWNDTPEAKAARIKVGIEPLLPAQAPAVPLTDEEPK